MGSPEGALRTAANRTGHSVTEYLDRVNAGLRWCFRDQAWESCEEFARDKSRSDGLARSCRRSTNAAARSRYKSRPRAASGRRLVSARNDDALQARRRVNYLVELGHIPHPNTLLCTDCRHEWRKGERRHEYDHHLGYSAEHHEDVEPVCTTCHHARERARREHDEFPTTEGASRG